MTSNFTWSIITVTYNNRPELEHFWAATRLPPTAEWIVVDNNSTDGSADAASAMGARVIELDVNVGFGAANNLGIAEATGDYVLFANPDVAVQPTDLPRLQSHLDEFPQDLVAPQLNHEDGSPQPNGRGAPILTHKVLHRIAPERLEGSYRIFASPDETRIVSWLMGAVVAGTAHRLRSLGPWDELFFVYYEDADLGLRNTIEGGRSLILGDVRWVHGWARETKRLNLRAWRLEIDSLIKFYRRYPKLILRANSE